MNIEMYNKIVKKRNNEGSSITPLTMFAEAWDYQQNKIDKLQKQIDESLDLIYKEKGAVESGCYDGVNADLIIGIGYDLHLTLKGESNETRFD